MPSLILPPFPVVPETGDTGVAPGDWEINGHVLEDGVLRGWDYSTDIIARREIKVGHEAIRTQTGVGAGAMLRLVASWSTGAGFEYQEVGFTREFKLQGNDSRIDLEMCVQGSGLAGAIVLSTSLVLVSRGARPAAVAASQPGSVLWHDDISVTLEGIGPRLPVLVADLEPESVAWSVRTSHDWLNAHPSVGIRVILNGQRRDIVEAVLANPPAAGQREIRSALFFDVGRQLLERALLEEEFEDGASFAPQTCGLAMANRLRAIFGRTIGEVRNLRDGEPEEFNSILQAGHSLFVRAS